MSQDFRLKYSRMFMKRQNGECTGVQVLKGQKMINSATYKIQLEDHTIGDLLRIYLLKRKDVKFAGYKVPHPLQDMLEIKVQTQSDGTNQIVKDTLSLLQKDLYELENQYEQKLKLKIMENS